jgi:hypothetical protein
MKKYIDDSSKRTVTEAVRPWLRPKATRPHISGVDDERDRSDQLDWRIAVAYWRAASSRTTGVHFADSSARKAADFSGDSTLISEPSASMR